MDADSKTFFQENDWKKIDPSGGIHDSGLLNENNKRTSNVEAFYVKGVACWVPHLLIEKHKPCCPNCSTNRYVDLKKCRWVNQPKLLCELERHRYLDTVLYHCTSCTKKFAGYNEKSMQLDSHVYFSYFNFYLGPKYAVSSELYRYVVLSSSLQSTAVIAKTLQDIACEAYYADYQLYLSAVGVNSQQDSSSQEASVLCSCNGCCCPQERPPIISLVEESACMPNGCVSSSGFASFRAI